MTPREYTQTMERTALSPFAMLSENTKGRECPQEPCSLRTEYQRDRDRIIHCKAFRRLKQKTQVFLSPEGDHYRTRLTHTLEVNQIARTIARALRLNEDLTEAIALGHDLGHTPFGHAGERALNKIMPGGFKHNQQSVRVVTYLEKEHQGLNLTWEVINGIGAHTGGEWATTLEGCVVRYSDRIAYINHDIEDAISAGVLQEADLPQAATQVLGHSKSARITTLITSLVNNSQNGEIKMDAAVEAQYLALHKFMFSTVYVDPKAKGEESKVELFIIGLYEALKRNPERMPDFYRRLIDTDGLDRAVGDYISGMSDDYAVRMYEAIYVPHKWSV